MKWFLSIFLTIFFALANAQPINQSLDWWQTTLIYQLIPNSFKDSNSDGVGDLKGIEEKAEYFTDTGIGTIWLTPIYKSSMVDLGYDVTDFKSINPILGTMADFESLRDKLHSLGLQLILDFVPNHTSDEHEWFIKSVQRIDPYTDYYVWKDPKGWINETTPIPPNNWWGVFQKPAWTYHPVRKQFYLHFFSHKQPDVNYRCEELFEEMKDIIRFWLDRGVDGFRMDTVIHLAEDDEYRDEPLVSKDLIVDGYPAYEAYDHKYTQCLPRTYEILRSFREVADSYKEKDGHTRLFVLETYANTSNTMKYFGNASHPIAQIPSNIKLVEYINFTSSARDYLNSINDWMNNLPEGEWPNWQITNHDRLRISDKFGSSSVDTLNILLLLLPGTPVYYQGEELGMEMTKLRWEQTVDVRGRDLGQALYTTQSRDPERTPFQWDSTRNAGFSDTNGTTWLPVNPDYYRINVEAQKNDPKSHYNIFKDLMKLRSTDVFLRGDFKAYLISERVLAFERRLKDDVYVVVLNLDNVEQFVDIRKIATNVNHNFKTVLVSQNSEYEIGHEFSTSSSGFQMRPWSTVVLRNF